MVFALPLYLCPVPKQRQQAGLSQHPLAAHPAGAAFFLTGFLAACRLLQCVHHARSHCPLPEQPGAKESCNVLLMARSTAFLCAQGIACFINGPSVLLSPT